MYKVRNTTRDRLTSWLYDLSGPHGSCGENTMESERDRNLSGRVREAMWWVMNGWGKQNKPNSMKLSSWMKLGNNPFGEQITRGLVKILKIQKLFLSEKPPILFLLKNCVEYDFWSVTWRYKQIDVKWNAHFLLFFFQFVCYSICIVEEV